MIIQVVILLIIIIIWLQYPQQTQDKDTEIPLYKKIFNIIKIPVVVICFIIIIYSFLNINPIKNNNINDMNVYMSIPKF